MDLLLNKAFMQEFLSPIWLSLKIATISGVVVILIGTLVGRLLARKNFKGKAILETILMLPMVLPPTVIGFFLIVIFGKNSMAGQAIEWLFKQPIIFTWWAAVIASAVVAFPLMYQSAKSGFQGVNLDIEEAARVDGASEWKILLFISIPLASKSTYFRKYIKLCTGPRGIWCYLNVRWQYSRRNSDHSYSHLYSD